MTWINDWLVSDQMQILLYNLMLSVLVLVFTYIIIKVVYRISNRLFKESGESAGGQTEKGIISESAVRSVRILIQTIILYGGYFIAAIAILEIFNVKVISPDDLKIIGTKALKIIGILVGAKLAINFGQLVVKRVFDKHDTGGRRAQTLEILLHSAITYLVFFLACLMILQVFNVNTSAILASAGILGLAVGFGAQSLVKDVISGFFILFEDQFSVGDYVKIDALEGTVEEIGLRTCKIRQWTGELNIIPNGGITRVTNYTRGPMLAVVTVALAYEEDIDEAIRVLNEECEAAYREVEAIIDVPKVLGVNELGSSSVNILIIAPSLPAQHWAVQRELRKRFKYALDRAGIEIPYPKQVVYHWGEENQNEASSLL